MLFQSNPTVRYLSTVFDREIAAAKTEGRAPEYPMGGEADTSTARLIWAKKLAGKPVIDERPRYNCDELRRRVKRFFSEEFWGLLADQCEVSRSVLPAILYGRGYYAEGIATVAVQRVEMTIAGYEAEAKRTRRGIA